MAITDSFAIPGYGTVFTAPVNTPLDDITAFTKDAEKVGEFENLGHTSSDNPIELSVDGGDATSKRSWLRDAIVTLYAGTTWTATGASLQTDRKSIQKIYNGWDTDDGLGSVIPSAKKGIDLAMVILSQDDSGKLAFYTPNVNFTYGDAPSFDIENFFETSFQATFQAPEPGILPAGPDGASGLFAFYGTDSFLADES